MSKFNTHTQAADNRTRIADQHRAVQRDLQATAHNAERASSRFLPLHGAGPIGIRGTDIPVFAAAAKCFDQIVILRDTNIHALKYIGEKQYVPKPFDCKLKTADNDAFLPGLARQIKCSGLVVDPTIVGFTAFDLDRVNKARDEWVKFIRDKSHGEQARKIYPRTQVKGFYAVDSDQASQHFGCMMLSEQAVPGPTFRLDSADWGEFKRNHMRYIHSDYDLYGLIDVAGTELAVRDSSGHGKFSPQRHEETLQGNKHYFTTDFDKIKEFINNGIGVDMIQHAGQDQREHAADTLYVFYPIGSKYKINKVGNSADPILEIYDYLFKQEVKR